MVTEVDLFQPRQIDMRVNLCRRNTGMSQHLLHLAEVSPARQQVRGETMSQTMRANRRGDSRDQGILFHQFPNRFTSKRSPGPGNKHPMIEVFSMSHQLRAKLLQIVSNRLNGRDPQRSHSLFAALAFHLRVTFLQIQVG